MFFIYSEEKEAKSVQCFTSPNTDISIYYENLTKLLSGKAIDGNRKLILIAIYQVKTEHTFILKIRAVLKRISSNEYNLSF